MTVTYTESRTVAACPDHSGAALIHDPDRGVYVPTCGCEVLDARDIQLDGNQRPQTDAAGRLVIVTREVADDGEDSDAWWTADPWSDDAVSAHVPRHYPDATYHGILRAECLSCGVVTTDTTHLEMMNDLDPTCDGCGVHYVRWTLANGSQSVTSADEADGYDVSYADPADGSVWRWTELPAAVFGDGGRGVVMATADYEDGAWEVPLDTPRTVEALAAAVAAFHAEYPDTPADPDAVVCTRCGYALTFDRGDSAWSTVARYGIVCAWGTDPDGDDAVGHTPSRVESSVWLDAATYPEDASGLAGDPFATEFRARGGVSATITPSWVHGLPVGDVFLHLIGTPAAVAYAESLLS